MKRMLHTISAACVLTLPAMADDASWVAFDWFEYRAEDPFYDQNPLAEGEFYNPILPGFYPDPSIVAVGGDYYLINSSFAYYPGVPIFHSRDLVHWTQLGHVLDRPSQLDLDGHRISRGIFAPTISYHDGVFYMVTTLVDTFGNFYVTATDPAGPWSEPVPLPEVDGIDPSFFFDDDGRAWLVNNGPPPDNKSLYDGHRAIWLQEFDDKAGKLVGPRTVIVNGGVDLAEKPEWIEGPHLLKRDGWYYLQCAEGGTSVNHRQVVFRSREVTGPYQPFGDNPMITQKHLPVNRAQAVAATGHADLVEMEDGSWWAVFLGTRPFADDYYSTGRQTFLLPVTWTDDGWPTILPAGEQVPLKLKGPAAMATNAPAGAMGQGNFTWRDDFGSDALDLRWVMIRTPRGQPWWSLDDPSGVLRLQARPVPLTTIEAQPSFLAHRQQHHDFAASTALAVPVAAKVEAGLVAFLDRDHYYFIGVRRGVETSTAQVFLERSDGEGTVETVASADLAGSPSALQVRIRGAVDTYHFAFSTDQGETWQTLGEQDARVLTISNAWGFTGVTLGLYARTVQ